MEALQSAIFVRVPAGHGQGICTGGGGGAARWKSLGRSELVMVASHRINSSQLVRGPLLKRSVAPTGVVAARGSLDLSQREMLEMRKVQVEGRRGGSFLIVERRHTSSNVRSSTRPLGSPRSCRIYAGNSENESCSHSTRRQIISLAPLVALSASMLLDTTPAEAAELPQQSRGEYPPLESMALAENVRLEDVENRDLQEALEAAVTGDLEQAEYLFGQLVEKYPESASMWSNRGSVRLSLARFQEAATDFTRAIELAPYAAVPFLNRAIAYEALGQYDAAVNDCRSAIDNDPHESAAWFNLGNVQTKRQEYREALEAYQTAADLSPGIAGYRLREANSLFQVGFATDAEKLIRSIVRKYPNYAEAHAALAGMLWGEGRLSLAEEQLTEATEFEPNFKNMRWVNDHVEWPPKLLKVYRDLLTLK